jgi:hypothetical protein
VLGTSPAIRLSVAGVQVGVNGTAAVWLAVEITSAAGAEPAKISKTASTNIVVTFLFIS